MINNQIFLINWGKKLRLKNKQNHMLYVRVQYSLALTCVSLIPQ